MIDIDEMAYRIAKKKAEPETLFEKTFVMVKQKSKEYSEKLAKDAVISIGLTLKNDFKSHGKNADVSVKLGKFRGHLFVTSAIILIDSLTDNQVRNTLEHLISKYSPKYKYKGFEDGRHKFNIR